MIYNYPAVFYNDEGKVAFHFYDIENLHSFGDNLDEAILAAEEILSDCCWELEQKGEQMPKLPTPLEKVKIEALQVVKTIRADTAKYAVELEMANERDAVLKADNPIRELLDRQHMKIKDLADLLDAPYRTCQDWSLGKSKPPQWALNLIIDKIL